jgi:hypothetical protein
MRSFTPREIVSELDKYIIGQRAGGQEGRCNSLEEQVEETAGKAGVA